MCEANNEAMTLVIKYENWDFIIISDYFQFGVFLVIFQMGILFFWGLVVFLINLSSIPEWKPCKKLYKTDD